LIFNAAILLIDLKQIKSIIDQVLSNLEGMADILKNYENAVDISLRNLKIFFWTISNNTFLIADQHYCIYLIPLDKRKT
jgi:hypothetical protein